MRVRVYIFPSSAVNEDVWRLYSTYLSELASTIGREIGRKGRIYTQCHKNLTKAQLTDTNRQLSDISLKEKKEREKKKYDVNTM